MNWMNFLSWFLGGGLGAYTGTTVARWQFRKKDAVEHDRQMAGLDARIEALRRIPERLPRLFSPN